MASTLLKSLLIFASLLHAGLCEKGYMNYVKDGCFKRGDALACLKYKALKVATKTMFGDVYSNETIEASPTLSLVPLRPELVARSSLKAEFSEPRGFMSEWTALAQYIMQIVEEFILKKGLRVHLPDGSEIEDLAREDDQVEGRGKRKRLAVIIPLLSLLATIKTKVLLVPVLLSVIFIKKLLLVAALLIPSLLTTLKACKIPHPPHHFSHYASSDAGSEFSSYGGGYAYSGAAPPGYSKDWAVNRAYALPKRPAPVYATAPGVME